jgi:hypothetical protein
MTKYNLKLLKQKQYYKGGKFETVETTDLGNGNTWENIKLATSKDTLKFFKSIGSKQQVKTEVKNGLYVVKIYSYEPNTNNTSRILHVYTEIKED